MGLFAFGLVFVVFIIPILACLLYLGFGIIQVVAGYREHSRHKKLTGWKIISVTVIGLLIIYLTLSKQFPVFS